jgi:hypothetical protein
MSTNPFVPQYPIGRSQELRQVCQIFRADEDLMIAGVSGSGRRSLVRWAAQQVGARIVEIDCLRATTASRFLTLLAEALLETFNNPDELIHMEAAIEGSPLQLQRVRMQRPHFVWQVDTRREWAILQTLIALPQTLAEVLNCRVVLVLQNFPHIRSWDRSGEWEAYLRQEVDRQSQVNSVVIATVPEPWAIKSGLRVISLAPLPKADLADWLVDAMANQGLKFSSDALELMLNYVHGHMGDTIALARRIWLDHRSEGVIQLDHVHRSTLSLVEDLALTFEALLLLLPPIQARVLECLALDPTDRPHAKDYIQKHQLSRGGGLQGALIGLEQKGLIYGPQYRYQVAMPLLMFWLKHRIA